MPLTATAVSNAKPTDKPRKLFDEGGLFLLVKPNGAKWWRLRYWYDGKEKQMSLGVYPGVTLKMARERRNAARQLLVEGIDPSQQRQAEKTGRRLAVENSFQAVAQCWYHGEGKTPGHKSEVSDSHAKRNWRRLEVHILPWLGDKPIGEITPPEILECLKRVQDTGALETAYRVQYIVSMVFRSAIGKGVVSSDPTRDLKGLLRRPIKGRMASVVRGQDIAADQCRVAELLRAIDSFSGTFPVLCALRLAPLVFLRPGELRHAQWSEIDLENQTWTIPPQRMKGDKQRKAQGDPHVVPLSTQAVAILRELQPLTGRSRFVFPSVRTPDRPMSESTLNAALKRLGFDGKTMTAHGFRTMASTLLNEQGWTAAAVERQLAHVEKDKVKGAYDRAHHLTLRRELMQAWSDYLDSLRGGATVIPIGAAKKQ